jgi:hypothetical protein
MQQAGTPLVLPVDADFQFSDGLHALLHAPSPYRSLAKTAGPSEVRGPRRTDARAVYAWCRRPHSEWVR